MSTADSGKPNPVTAKPAGGIPSGAQGGKAAPSKPSMTASLNQRQARTLPIPAGLSQFNTQELGQGETYFHGCLYGETSMRKTSKAGEFGKPENTLIVLTRRKEQMIPLRDLGIEVVLVEDATALRFALHYPERLWDLAKERRAKNGESPLGDMKHVVLDDGTEAVAMLLEDAEVIDGKKVRDRRRSYTEAGNDLREMLKTTLTKPFDFILVALAKVRDNQITKEEQIGPDLPPSMLNMLTTEMEFVFYIKPGMYSLLTERDFFSFQDDDPSTGKSKTYKRTIFAKSKFPLSVIKGNKGASPLAKYEDRTLGEIWEAVKGITKMAIKPASVKR